MSQCLHDENISATRSVYTGQFAFAAGIWQSERMKLKLKSLRLDRGLTIDQLADLSGISRGYISLLENGRRQPSSDALQTLASSLRVRVTDLIDEGPENGDVTTIVNIMSALAPEDRQAIIREAAARLKRSAS